MTKGGYYPMNVSLFLSQSPKGPWLVPQCLPTWLWIGTVISMRSILLPSHLHFSAFSQWSKPGQLMTDQVAACSKTLYQERAHRCGCLEDTWHAWHTCPAFFIMPHRGAPSLCHNQSAGVSLQWDKAQHKSSSTNNGTCGFIFRGKLSFFNHYLKCFFIPFFVLNVLVS